MSVEDSCFFGLQNWPPEEGGVGGLFCPGNRDLATLLGWRVVSVEDSCFFFDWRIGRPHEEEGGVGGLFLVGFEIWQPTWGGGWCRWKNLIMLSDWRLGNTTGEEGGVGGKILGVRGYREWKIIVVRSIWALATLLVRRVVWMEDSVPLGLELAWRNVAWVKEHSGARVRISSAVLGKEGWLKSDTRAWALF